MWFIQHMYIMPQHRQEVALLLSYIFKSINSTVPDALASSLTWVSCLATRTPLPEELVEQVEFVLLFLLVMI
jgi:hypothetical protein